MAVHELAAGPLVIGIDEVGRGALAGPVVVAAAAVMGRVRKNQTLGALKDSKKLSARQREAWYVHFSAQPNIVFAVARVYPRQIEKRNISAAANLAASRAYLRLMQILKNYDKSGARHTTKIFLDGGLYLRNKNWQSANVPAAKTVVKADEKIAAVAVASIIAKIQRDRFMKKLAGQYPGYGFEVHKGYGTRRHINAMKKEGLSVLHRITFCAKL